MEGPGRLGGWRDLDAGDGVARAEMEKAGKEGGAPLHPYSQAREIKLVAPHLYLVVVLPSFRPSVRLSISPTAPTSLFAPSTICLGANSETLTDLLQKS